MLLYILTWHFEWNIPAYPNGYWWFNPFAWQFLFVFGAWCALGGAKRLEFVISARVTIRKALGPLIGILLRYEVHSRPLP